MKKLKGNKFEDYQYRYLEILIKWYAKDSVANNILKGSRTFYITEKTPILGELFKNVDKWANNWGSTDMWNQ